MKILISADMEGISGVTRWEETQPGTIDYSRFRKIMTEEVNAAIAGSLNSGASEVIVADGHGGGFNILLEDLDERARLNSGGESPSSMMQGLDSETSGVLFIGYHARAGSQNAVLAHTWSSICIANVWLNKCLVGEYGLNAALAGHFAVPVIMISGDQTACGQAVELLGSLETVIVKQATGYFSAECLNPKETLAMVKAATERAVLGLIKGTAPKPLLVKSPVTVAIEFRQPEFADRAEYLPGMKRIDNLRIEFVAPDMLSAHKNFRAAVRISRG
jgi:D-amino peptidase